ncbi:GNAT family N-acetyltransferase [Microbacterium sp. NPDC091313]
MTPEVRRVRLHEWELVRDLRIAAVSDPAAALAFLTTPDQERARDEESWRSRTARGAMADSAAQFVAVLGDRGVGSADVILRGADAGHPFRADIVGVWIAPDQRGRGLLAVLVDAAREWAASRGQEAVTLSVHRDNARARAAYEKIGFAPTGVSFTSAVGPEIELRRAH